MKIQSLNKVTMAEPSQGREVAIRAREDKLSESMGGQPAAPPPKNQQIEDVAKMYEKQFLREMVKAMRSTVAESDLVPQSMGEKIYKSQMDEEYVEQWSNQGGTGMSEMIYEQIMDRYFKKPQSAKMLGQQGPIQISNRDIAKAMRVEGGRPQQTSVKVDLKTDPTKPQSSAQVQVPWDATLVTKTKLPDGKNAVVLDHGAGMRSTFIFEGVPSALEPGSKIARGTSVGVLSPENNSFIWNMTDVEPNVSKAAPDKGISGPDLGGPEKDSL